MTKSLLNHTELEDTLLKYSQTYFAKAEDSPFTNEPLSRLLQYNGITLFDNWITDGAALSTLHQFDKPTTAILENLKWKVPKMDKNNHALDYNSMMDGIKKWPERTMTSPLGFHLGIYKTLQKHVLLKPKNKQTMILTPTSNDRIKEGHDILFLIFNRMQLALEHTYPLIQWQKVWTVFIKKEIGNPNLQKLCCIMIFEANWQLLLKWHSLYGFLPQTEKMAH